METKDIKQLQYENKKLKKEYCRLLEEVQRLRVFEKETKLPSSIYLKRLIDSNIKKEFFDGENLSVVSLMSDNERSHYMLYLIERIVGLKPNGEAANYLISQICGKENKGIGPAPFPFAPLKDENGWLLDLIKLTYNLMQHIPWRHCFSLKWLGSRFEAGVGDDPYDFSPKNKQLMEWIEDTQYRRVAALVGKFVENVAIIESQRLSTAIYDYIWDSLHDKTPDWADVKACNEYVNCLLKTIEKVDNHIKEGKERGLSIEEIGLIDSLWGEITHNYNKMYLAATKEIWQKIKPVRENFYDGRKSREDCELFVNDMLKIALPIAERHNLDMELDDEHSLPLSYLKYWLDSIYCYDDYGLE